MVELNVAGIAVLVFCGIAVGIMSLSFGHGSLFDEVRAWLAALLKCEQAELNAHPSRTQKWRVYLCTKLNTLAQCPYCLTHWFGLGFVVVLAGCCESVTIRGVSVWYGWLLWLLFKMTDMFVMVFIATIAYSVIRYLDNLVNRHRGRAAAERVEAGHGFYDLLLLEKALAKEGLLGDMKLSERIRGKKSGEPAPYDTCIR